MNKLEKLAERLTVDIEFINARAIANSNTNDIWEYHDKKRAWSCIKTFYVKNQDLIIGPGILFRYITNSWPADDTIELVNE